MKRRLKIEVACHPECQNGEAPVWSEREQALFWIDTRGALLFRRDIHGKVDSWSLGERTGAIGLRKDGGLIATLASGIYAIDIDGVGQPVRKALLATLDLAEGLRLKEGKTDPGGRWWFGSVDDRRTPEGSFYRLAPDGQCDVVDRGILVANGIAFPAAGNRMFTADTLGGTVWTYDLDPSSGAVTNKRSFFSTDELPGYVDGATFDDEGYYWCAFFGDWAVARISPAGHIDRMVRLPVQYPTQCGFGGPDLDIMYVTTSLSHVKAAEAAGQPLAGALFQITGLGVRGIPEPMFG